MADYGDRWRSCPKFDNIISAIDCDGGTLTNSNCGHQIAGRIVASRVGDVDIPAKDRTSVAVTWP